MVLWLIGLGLCDERDITLRGLDAVKGCERVYLEAYTSMLMVDKGRLEALYGKEIVVADREMVESAADGILERAGDADVAFLVVGDPFGATTHTDLQLRARERGIEVRVVHNASVLNAVGAAGLQLYRFGAFLVVGFVVVVGGSGGGGRLLIPPHLPHAQTTNNQTKGETVSIVFFTDTWRPDSFYDKIAANRRLGLHTLCLLDIKVKEPNLEQLCRGRTVYEPPR